MCKSKRKTSVNTNDYRLLYDCAPFEEMASSLTPSNRRELTGNVPYSVGGCGLAPTGARHFTTVPNPAEASQTSSQDPEGFGAFEGSHLGLSLQERGSRPAKPI
jgi:hypothetical protein